MTIFLFDFKNKQAENTRQLPDLDAISTFEVEHKLFTTFFKSCVDLVREMSTLTDLYRKGKVPTDVTDSQSMIKEHEAGKTSIESIFASARFEIIRFIPK